jgi:ribosomal protein L35AE/L33A
VRRGVLGVGTLGGCRGRREASHLLVEAVVYVAVEFGRVVEREVLRGGRW